MAKIPSENVSLLMLFNGNFNDESVNNHGAYQDSGTTTFSDTQKVEGSKSAFFDASLNNIAVPSSPTFNIGSNEPFTIEFSVYPISTIYSYQTIIGTNNNNYDAGSVYFQYRNNKKITLGGKDFGSRPTSPELDLNTWYDVCISRTTNNKLIFLVRNVNTGFAVRTEYNSFIQELNFNGLNGLTLGWSKWDGSSGAFNGNLDALRFSKGFSVFEGLSNAEIMEYENFYRQLNYEISGNVTLDGKPTGKSVFAITNDFNDVRLLGNAISEPTTGKYQILTNYTLPVIVFTMQDYGEPWEQRKTLVAGSTVHPTAPNGYFYRVTNGGITGTSEPNWPTTEGQTVTDGEVSYSTELLLKPEIAGYKKPTPIQ